MYRFCPCGIREEGPQEASKEGNGWRKYKGAPQQLIAGHGKHAPGECQGT
jgi:hypothetical protein